MPKPPSPVLPDAAWRRSGRTVALVPDAFEGISRGVHVDLSAPSAGLVIADGDSILGLDIGHDGEASDAWIRGSDLTACWEPRDERELRATASWRCHRRGSDLAPPPGVAAWELIASATSRRLHADATLTVSSAVAAREVVAAPLDGGRAGTFAPPGAPGQALFLVRRDGGTSVAIVIHPADRHAVDVSIASGRARVRCALFASGVEKGVLLRSSVLAAVGPSHHDLRWVIPIAERFCALPPELST